MRISEDGAGMTRLLCVGPREAAGMLGVSSRAVRNLIARGELEARSDGAAARILIPVASVERLRAERHAERRVRG
jgi:Helix-turn-helix domain